jgi:hypothetical protein
MSFVGIQEPFFQVKLHKGFLHPYQTRPGLRSSTPWSPAAPVFKINRMQVDLPSLEFNPEPGSSS